MPFHHERSALETIRIPDGFLPFEVQRLYLAALNGQLRSEALALREWTSNRDVASALRVGFGKYRAKRARPLSCGIVGRKCCCTSYI